MFWEKNNISILLPAGLPARCVTGVYAPAAPWCDATGPPAACSQASARGRPATRVGRTHCPRSQQGSSDRERDPLGRAGCGERGRRGTGSEWSRSRGQEQSAARRQGEKKSESVRKNSDFRAEQGTGEGYPRERRPEEGTAGAGTASRAPSIPLRSRGALPGPRLRRPPPVNARPRWEDAQGAADAVREGAPAAPRSLPRRSRGDETGVTGGRRGRACGGAALPPLCPRPCPASPPAPSPSPSPRRPHRPLGPDPDPDPGPDPAPARRPPLPSAPPRRPRGGPAPPRPPPIGRAARLSSRMQMTGGSRAAPIGCKRRPGPALRPRPPRCGTIALVTRC